MRWAQAVKIWNAHKKTVNASHVYCLPKKGTPEHAHVKHIQDGGAPEAFPPKKFDAKAAKERGAKIAEVASKIKRSAAARTIQKAVKARAAKKDIIEGEFTDMAEEPKKFQFKKEVKKAIREELPKEKLYRELGYFLYRRLDTAKKINQKTEMDVYSDMIYIKVSPETYDDEQAVATSGIASFKELHKGLGDLDYYIKTSFHRYYSGEANKTNMSLYDTGIHFNIYEPKYEKRSVDASLAADVIEDFGRMLIGQADREASKKG